MTKAPKPSEGAVQISILHRLQFHGLQAWHVANGGSRHFLEARKLKAQGVRAGVPDLIVIGDAGRVAWLEVKRPGYSPSDVSEAQREVHDYLRSKGHHVAIVTGQDEAVSACREAGLLR